MSERRRTNWYSVSSLASCPLYLSLVSKLRTSASSLAKASMIVHVVVDCSIGRAMVFGYCDRKVESVVQPLKSDLDTAVSRLTFF